MISKDRINRVEERRLPNIDRTQKEDSGAWDSDLRQRLVVFDRVDKTMTSSVQLFKMIINIIERHVWFYYND